MSNKPNTNNNVSPYALVHPSAKVWQWATIREAAEIGENCIIGQNAYIGAGVKIGRNCKIQNNALIYEPAKLDEGILIGPGAVLTNDRYPRAVNPDGALKSASDWSPSGVTIHTGASIGANSVCVAPITIGEWAMIGAGSVVTRDVPAHALVVGVPAKQIGWVSKTGERLVQEGSQDEWRCPSTGIRYKIANSTLTEVTK